MKRTVITMAVLLACAATVFAEDPYEEAWTAQIGTASGDYSQSVAVDASGNAYISGYTYGDLGGTNAGGVDAFLTKYEVPEPATMSLLALGGLALIRKRRDQGQ